MKTFNVLNIKQKIYKNKAFIVLYHEGSSVIQAILQKKNIINLHGNYLGTYINKRCELYAKLLDIKRYDLENYKLDDKESLINDLNACKPNYEKYIRENIIQIVRKQVLNNYKSSIEVRFKIIFTVHKLNAMMFK